MAANSIAQLKKPFLFHYLSAAKKYIRLDPYILDGFDADNLIYVHPQKPVFFIFHAKPQRTKLPVRAADRNNIYRTNLLLHCGHLLPVLL
jgi:hypothetical protein